MGVRVTSGRGEETNKDRNFHASNWLFAQTTHVDIALSICMWGRVREVVLRFKYYENRLRGRGAEESRTRPVPLTWIMAYTAPCITVQTVITACELSPAAKFSAHRSVSITEFCSPLRFRSDDLLLQLCSGLS